MTPRPYGGDHRLPESEFEVLLHTDESVRSDLADIEEISCAPTAPPNDVLSRLVTFHTSVRRPRGRN